MSLQCQLVARLQRFDDEALIAWANRGLFRRATKDLEQHNPRVLQDAASFRVIFADQQIEFSSDEPRAGRCDCKSAGVCQHLISALLWLKRQNIVPTATESATVDADFLLEIDDVALKNYAGAAAFRWAREYAEDLDLAREFEFSNERYPVLRLPRLQFELRCIGATLADFVAPAHAQAKKYTLVALLAYRLSRGQVLAPLGVDIVDSLDAATRTRLLAEICQYACEVIELGLTHLSPALSERTELLATWAQAQGCYRLAARLRRCGEQIDAALARLAHSDSATLLDELAFTYALAQGLQQALIAGRWPSALVGKARRSYEETDALQLWGLAAWPFQSASGFCGLSVLFYAPDERAFFTLTDARPASLSFDPFSRFTQTGPWCGMTSPSATLGQALEIRQPRSAGQRLSANEATVVQRHRALLPSDQAALVQVTYWRALPKLGARSLWLVGSEEYACLKPTAWQPTRFDPHRQILYWPLLDENGQELMLTLHYSGMHARAVAALERYASTAKPGNSLIFVRLHDDGVQPVGWLQQDGETLSVGAPFFAAIESAEAIELNQTARAHTAITEHPEIDAWRRFLLTHAERGISAAWPAALAAQRASAAAHGLQKLSAIAPSALPSEVLLRCWIYLQQLNLDYSRELAHSKNAEPDFTGF